MPRTKVRRFQLRGFQQFADTTLDFTHPETGEALDRICLIGRNGTGKSTILRLLDEWLARLPKTPARDGQFALTVEHDGRHLLCWSRDGDRRGLIDVTNATDDGASLSASDDELAGAPRASAPDLRLAAPRDLLVYSPVDVAQNVGVHLGGMPDTKLDDALALMRGVSTRHEVSDATLAEMWRYLVYLVKRRESDQQEFERRPENLQKTKAQLITEFDATNPPVLEALADLWNRILAPAGLEFDVAGARVPVQLNENLEAYVTRIGSGERVAYNQLSTGIRHFLFRIGHLFLLYFGRDIERGFVLVDEPENSLFPDFLFDLVETWEHILRRPDGTTHTQLFVATHNPIVAAQFEPYERVVLEWDESGHVFAKRGVAPKGDDPNDVLLKDFELPEVMGPTGRQRWHEYLALRKRIRSAPEAEKPHLVEEAAAIAGEYGFEPGKPQ